VFDYLFKAFRRFYKWYNPEALEKTETQWANENGWHTKDARERMLKAYGIEDK
jgi:hypothetical protein